MSVKLVLVVGAGEVRIRVAASTVNPTDTSLRCGRPVIVFPWE